MEKNNNIQESLTEIKKAIREPIKQSSQNDIVQEEEYILLDNIISSPKIKGNQSTLKSSKTVANKLGHIKKNNISKGSEIKQKEKKKLNVSKKLNKSVTKKTDPIAKVVEKDIKPIIKKWINKNLRQFVKKIVIEEMQLISKPTEKPPNR